ncbi:MULTISPECIES: Lrp/AsnC family transcriptional regulator [Amycolatopsis]|uniref:Lrp/AsnC family transcriptional regulator n=1 Tax=Amycolatopsis albidoflavus TaxID=102226 RepID=A0ABW5HUT4_9PSEU
MLSEDDLKLVDALQSGPRAPWSAVAKAAGMSAFTAARRWQRLVERGDAWITAYRGGDLRGRMVLSFVEIGCAPGCALDIARRLAADSRVTSVECTDGQHDLLVHVVARSLQDLAEYLTHQLSAVSGAVSSRTHVLPRLFREGDTWRVRAIPPGRRDTLLRSSVRRASLPNRFDPLDHALLEVLGEDGRAPASEIAARIGTGETTVRWRLAVLLASGTLILCCEIARSLSPAPVTAMLRIRVQPDPLAVAAQALAALPETRICAAVSGEANVLLIAWLTSQRQIVALEDTLAARFPPPHHLEIVDRAVMARPVKLMGRMLDAEGRSVGQVPLFSIQFPLKTED